jgi:hypothetical protein
LRDESDDIELEEELRLAALRFDPVPPELAQAAIEAFSWRDIDAELAELVFDSLVSEDDVALVRSSADRRLVSFRSGALTIDVEVTGSQAGYGLVGQIAPGQAAAIDIRHRGEVITIGADEMGRFSTGPLPGGPVSLRVMLPAESAEPAVVTDWFSL